jgi:uncharacterized damage-inducible protein DinB
MAPNTPYSASLGDLEPLGAIRETLSRIRQLADRWTDAQYERNLAPGKWTARQILIHLAHAEIVFGTRIRMALTAPGYTVQLFEQDDWIKRETGLTGPEALEAFAVMSRMNLRLFEGLTAEDRQTTMTHPERGTITVDWIIHLTAGHQLHHLRQLEQLR